MGVPLLDLELESLYGCATISGEGKFDLHFVEFHNLNDQLADAIRNESHIFFTGRVLDLRVKFERFGLVPLIYLLQGASLLGFFGSLGEGLGFLALCRGIFWVNFGRELLNLGLLLILSLGMVLSFRSSLLKKFLPGFL